MDKGSQPNQLQEPMGQLWARLLLLSMGSLYQFSILHQISTILAASNNTHVLFHSFCGPGVQQWLIWLTKGCSQNIHQPGGDSISKLTQGAGRIQSLAAVGLSALAACWLLADGCPQLLATQMTPPLPPTQEPLTSSKSAREFLEQVCKQDGLIYPIVIITFTMFCCQKSQIWPLLKQRT